MLTALRGRLSAAAVVLALAAAMVTVTDIAAPAARANDKCTEVSNPDGSTTCVFTGQQGGGGGGGEGSGTGIDCNASGTIAWKGKTYQCAYGDWTFSAGCYIKVIAPQPATNDPIWGSSDPATNRVQWEDCDHIPPTEAGAKRIVGPCVGYCAGPNPVERITNELQIDKPELGMAKATIAAAVENAPLGSAISETTKGLTIESFALSIMSAATLALRPPMKMPVRATPLGPREKIASWVRPFTPSRPTSQ